jgi:hypothetical protein
LLLFWGQHNYYHGDGILKDLPLDSSGGEGTGSNWTGSFGQGSFDEFALCESHVVKKEGNLKSLLRHWLEASLVTGTTNKVEVSPSPLHYLEFVYL